MLGENPSRGVVGGDDVKDSGVASTHDSVQHTAADRRAVSEASSSAAAARAVSNLETPPSDTSTRREPIIRAGKGWWLLAAASALLLSALTVAGVYLVTKKPSTVDQVVILTVPSGAEIRLNSKDYGHSPVKLEQLAIGTYTLTITKEGFEPIEQPITVTESGPLEFKLNPVLPSEAVDLPAEERIKQFQQRAEEALARGYYGLVYEGSARYYADLILNLDSGNAFALDMHERVRIAAHQQAQAAISRGDPGQAQEIYNFLIEYYPKDDEARAAAARLESQLSARRGEVREFVRKADEALQAGNLTEPARASAYYYSKQALAIDRQNERARQIRNQVKETLASAGDQASARGDTDAAIKQLEQVAQLFPEDKQIRVRLRELQANRATETAKAGDASTRRIRGLDEYRKENFGEAIPDLEYAVFNGRGTPDAVFALARSYMKIGQYDQATSYFRQVPSTSGDHYRSSIAALGDIAYQRGDTATAVERYKEARQMGGSTIYSIAILDDKIERIERRQREKAAEPSPISIQVKHLHGGLLGGSCSGTLTINQTGVRYDGNEHVYSSNLVGVGVSITKDEMAIRFQGNTQKFKVARPDAEHFRETLARYQQTYSPSKN